MTSSINHEQEYQQAQKAYIQGNYEEAATIVDRLVQGFPDDPNSRLLRGHIYCVLRQYEIAREQYQVVMNLTDDLELIDCANNGLDSVNQYENADQIASNTTHALGVEDTFLIAGDSSERFDYGVKAEQQHSENLNQLESLNTNNFDSFNHDVEPADKSEQPFGSFFEEARESSKNYNSSGESSGFVDPFNLNQTHSTQSPDATHYEDLLDESSSSTDAFESSDNHHSFNEVYGSLNGSFEEVPDYNSHNYSDNNSNFSLPADDSLQSFESGSSPDRARENESSSIPFTQSSPTDSFEVAQQKLTSSPHSNGFHYQDSYNLDTFDSGLDEPAADAFLENANYQDEVAQSSINFIDEFDVGNTEFELPPSSQLSDSGPLSSSLATNWTNEGDRHSEENSLPSAGLAADLSLDNSNNKKNNTRKNWLATFENASLAKKQWLTASTVGVTSALVVAAISIGGGLLFPSKDTKAAVREPGLGLAMTVAAGIAGFATTRYLGRLTLNQLQQTTMDLRTQFNAVREGNLSAQATVYSDDEFGLLASEFNDMLRGISKNTLETQRKAEEQEHAKEELQRQVIRLLDDVEGAARGDLTVQAEVTADVLGAVADSFNLTIQSLREIVQQVKLAARQVSQGAADSETFARVLSSDALRQAEELAVSLNSVQVLTDAIQRVAETAREAETVARSASATAQKGGEAVERTVAGILEIRQTVAETTRKVKRLAESSQEISKIVALISQIASRTNMLALNASIEAARAGESGRGFAIVADEVRQLADRVAKALKEIEQIVRQIQSETGSVMTAMEEGTQQVIEGTKLAEQAKRSLEDIVQVSNHIDALVGSITADTVQQTETSRAVAVVVQSVELTAQETSQEAQRVSNSLHSLAGVAGNLLNSVERFRV